VVPEGELAPPEVTEVYTSSEPEPAYPELTAADLGIDLTDEDITYLRLKWGNKYRPEEWVQLE